MLHLSIWIFTFAGTLATVFQVILTFYLLYKYILKSNTWKKKEYQLILFRVFVDALIGVGGLSYFVSSIPTILHSEHASFVVSLVIGIISYHFFDMRSFLAAVIAIERVLAVMLPVGFYKYRHKVSNCPIFVFILSTGLSAYIMLFGVCDFRFPIDPMCTTFFCATSACYRTYEFVVKMIYSTTNVFFSLLLCYKLWFHSKHTQVTADIRRLNWLSLTDGLCTLTFDLLPSLVININQIDVRNIGPVMSTFRHTARAVEAAVMVKLMKKKVVVSGASVISVRLNVL